jgi:ArsR family transcriptional regulator, arsenate/arsenite/antimonite-responsive transcriptional repressor
MDAPLLVLKALADRNRLRMVAALTERGELCACQLTELSGVAGATVSRHLSLLVQAGVAESRKEGRWVHYRLRPGVADKGPLAKWLREALADSPDVERDRKALDRILARDREDLCRDQRGVKCCSDKDPVPRKG